MVYGFGPGWSVTKLDPEGLFALASGHGVQPKILSVGIVDFIDIIPLVK